jgi:uncharacterized membrane protein
MLGLMQQLRGQGDAPMNWYLVLKLLHILSAVVFAGGLVARQVVRAVAQRAQDVHVFAAQSVMAGLIENRMVIPGSIAVMAFGVALALVSGQPILGFIMGAAQNWLLVANILLAFLLLLVPLVFIPRGKNFAVVLQEALARSQMTPELYRELRDPVVRLAHWAELIGVVVIVFLMVAKPF